MFQTLDSKNNKVYVKSLINTLSSKPLPMIETVRYGDYIVKGFKYLYQTYIIECTKTGYLVPVSEQKVVGENVLCSDTTVIGTESSEYKVIKTFLFGQYEPNVTQYKSFKTSEYTSEVHEALGDYLRACRDLYNINMMPFYNMWSGRYLNNIDLELNTVNDTKKRLLIPIKFNKTYTICVDSHCEVKLRSIVYDIREQKLVKSDNITYVTDLLYSNKVRKYNTTSFKTPITYTQLCTDTSVYTYKNDLYLCIELSDSVTSSILVLEGNYATKTSTKIINIENMSDIRPDILDEVCISNLSLMLYNDKQTYAFSNRVLEFISGHMITPQETISQNVYRLQDGLGCINTPDVFDDELRYVMYKNYIINNPTTLDITGFGDKDIESYICPR